MSSLPVVAVVGRPNVGKSTLVNRIIGSRSAVVEEMAGVTRDRRQFVADWAGRDFIVVDTGGWEVKPDGDLNLSIRQQAEGAVSGADVVILVLDGTTELHRRYHQALLREIREAGEALGGAALDTIFFGGGTPTTLQPHELLELA